MKVFLDTNILIDYASQRQPFCQSANAIMHLCHNGYIEAYASSLTFVTMAYILRKQVSREDIYRCMRGIASFVSITTAGDEEIHRALIDEWRDFEDCVQFHSASTIAADVIITRNKSDFEGKSIQLMSPDEFLEFFLNQGA